MLSVGGGFRHKLVWKVEVGISGEQLPTEGALTCVGVLSDSWKPKIPFYSTVFLMLLL